MIADAKGRLLHTYNDTMSAWGVGRLRLSKPENMPITSLPVYVLLDDREIYVLFTQINSMLVHLSRRPTHSIHLRPHRRSRLSLQ